MDQSQYDLYGTDPMLFGVYGEDTALEDPYNFDFGFDTPTSTTVGPTGSLDPGRENGDVPIPPQPPVLQIQAQLDAAGNWFYPSVDQNNRDLRIQCEAFRAGAASRSGRALPLRNLQASRPQTSPMAPPRKILKPVSRRLSRPTRSKPSGTGSRRKRTSVAQICVCSAATFTPKRPPNAFMLFRTTFYPRLVKAVEDDPSLRSRNDKTITLQAAVSSLASEWWNEAKRTGEDKQYWDLAKVEKAAHNARYPDYVYQAGKKYQLSWGDATCRCGAFQANEAKKRERAAARDGFEPGDDDEDDFEDEEEGDPPYPSPTPRAAPPKRPSSRSSLGERPAKRRAGSTLANNNASFPTGFDNNAMLPTNGNAGDFGYGGGMNNNTILYNNTNQTGLPFPSPQTQAPVAQMERQRSRPTPIGPNNPFPTTFQGQEVTEQDFRDMLGGLDDPPSGNGGFDTSFPAMGETNDTATDQQYQERSASYDSLFDMDDFETPRPSRRSSRRSQG